MNKTITSAQFAYIDIKTGRKKLLSTLDKKVVPITLKGKIVDAFSGDDGTSILFIIELDDFKLGKRKVKK